jgi:hypothetical protein
VAGKCSQTGAASEHPLAAWRTWRPALVAAWEQRGIAAPSAGMSEPEREPLVETVASETVPERSQLASAESVAPW